MIIKDLFPALIYAIIGQQISVKAVHTIWTRFKERFGDIAIRRGMMELYGLSKITKEQFNEYKKGYSPYGSVASIYLWKLTVKK